MRLCVKETCKIERDSAVKAWEAPALRYVGDVTEIVRMPGNGKTGTGADPGDFLKPPGIDP